MWCAYAFALFDLLSLPDAIRSGTAAIVSWVAQTFLQLVLLSVIMVGQNVQAAAADKRAEATFHDASATLHEVAHVQGHLAAQDVLLTRIAERIGLDPSRHRYPTRLEAAATNWTRKPEGLICTPRPLPDLHAAAATRDGLTVQPVRRSPKPQFSIRPASCAPAAVPVAGLSSTTPISVRPFLVASNSRQCPASSVYPSLIPSAP